MYENDFKIRYKKQNKETTKMSNEIDLKELQEQIKTTRQKSTRKNRYFNEEKLKECFSQIKQISKKNKAFQEETNALYERIRDNTKTNSYNENHKIDAMKRAFKLCILQENGLNVNPSSKLYGKEMTETINKHINKNAVLFKRTIDKDGIKSFFNAYVGKEAFRD